MNIFGFIVGLLSVFAIFGTLFCLFKALTIRVEDESNVLLMKFGKLTKIFRKPGLQFVPERVLPWVTTQHVSMQRDFRHYAGIHINDKNGTSVVADLWLDFRIVAPEKALFEVEDWEEALQNLVVHSTTSILCGKNFTQILTCRNEISDLLFNDIAQETGRWGLQIDKVFLKNVGLIPEVSRHLLDSVASKLERSKAMIEEEGRLRIEQLHAQTDSEVASLLAESKSQYPLQVARAYAELSAKPKVFHAYKELHHLSLIDPSKTVFFSGFRESLDPMSSAMVIPNLFNDKLGLEFTN